MASLRVHPDRLEIHLTTAEKTLALRREDLVIPRENIRSVTITDDPWIWVRGIRAPGALVPLVLAIGVWKFHGGKDFLAIKRKRQAVVLHLRGDDFARVILSTNHAPDLISSLKLDGSETAEPTGAVASAEPAAAEPAAAEPAVAAKSAPVKRPRARKVTAPVESADAAETAQPSPVVKPVSPKTARPRKAAKPTDAPAAATPDSPEETA